ncbi:MAG: DUF4446 family protein [Deltaproteobacteria bacterium]
METLRDIAPFVALGAAVLSLALLVVVIVLLARVGKLRRAQTVVLGHHEQRDIVAHTEDLDAQVRNLREAVEILTDQLDDQKRHLDHALTNRAIIRYDAFRDAGGEQSASFALLDQYRSGVIFSAIAARDFARIYVKHVTEGVADRDLSPEEARVMEAAVPRPLKGGEEGPRAIRAPLPDSAPPAGLRDAAPEGPPTEDAPPSPQATAAFEALGEAVGPAGAPEGAGARPGDASDAPAVADDDFTWDPPPGPPRGGASRR